MEEETKKHLIWAIVIVLALAIVTSAISYGAYNHYKQPKYFINLEGVQYELVRVTE